jgi:hypothetical protein
MTSRPDTTEYAQPYANYVALVPEGDILGTLEKQLDALTAFLRAIPEAEGNTRHPPYTWSVKDVVGHITDAEHIFGCRALRFAREDPTPLPGFDENPYVRSADFDACRLSDLVTRFELLRRAHLCLFRSLPAAAWHRTGIASGHPVSVRALAYIIAGHTEHHARILRKRLDRGSKA